MKLNYQAITKISNPLIRTLLFYAILVISLTAIWLFGLQEISGFNIHALLGHILKNIGDMLILTSPFWFLSPRLKRWFAVFPLFMAIFIDVNLWYFRAWNQVIPPYMYFMFGNFDSTLLHSAEGLMKAKDIIPFAIALLPPISLCFLTPLNAKLSLKQKWLFVLLSVIIFSGSVFLKLRAAQIRDRKYDNIERSYLTIFKATYWPARYDLNYLPLEKNAFVAGSVAYNIYWLKVIFLNNLSQILQHSPSQKDMEEISPFLQKVPYSIPDSAFLMNSDRNLILIIAESFSSRLIGDSVDGVEITPNLNRLCNTDGSVSCKNIIPQICGGISIDGQTIINTGLLPVSYGLTQKIYGKSLTFVPTLAYRLRDRHPICIIGSDGTMWNEGKINEKFGYKVFTNKYFKQNIITSGTDRALFDFGLDMIDTLKTDKPFFLQFITMSMHNPYNERCIPEFKEFDDLPELEKHYLQAARYFDATLGYFIERLKRKGIYDNTVIIVASDHHQQHNVKDKNGKLAFFGAFNCGLTQKIDRIAGQANIYPTILQIMGVNKSKIYNGLGPSLFDTSLNGAIDSDGNIFGHPDTLARQASDISAKIWSGNYFGNLP